MRSLLERMLAEHTGRTEEAIRKDIERDKIFSSDEAKEYGIIDEVIKTRKSSRLATAR
ncbi:ATP-dependent Clp protease proteolytic subunit, partial [Frankia sp. EI5c]|uniref:ATP-dependent Clp protease proteolytic subunit n=1 Tax=Frankia sp. EI5c TaxID=683316 RepID=UPI001F5BFCD3